MGRRTRVVTVPVDIDAPVARVWRALCSPREVQQWDGAVPVAIADGYPQAGMHARWRIAMAGLPTVLHDHVIDVVPERTLRARLVTWWWTIDETYTLTPLERGTHLESHNEVVAWPLAQLAARSCRRSVTASLGRLKTHCESAPGSA